MSKQNLKQFFFSLLFLLILIKTSAAQRSQVPIGTRPAGMGDAFVSVANDGNALYWNPAGIGALGHHELNSMTTNAFQINLRHQFLSYIFPLSDDHALGFGWFSEGLFDDEELDWGWNIYQLTYGRQLFKTFSFGLSLKYADNSIGLDERNLDKSNGLGLDFGLLYPYRNFQLGLCLRDIGGLSVKHNNGNKEKILEQAISLGVSYRTYFDILLAGAITFDDRIFFGAEYWGWKNLFALRAGMQRDIYDTPSPETIFSLGASLKYKIFQFDYAYTTHPTLRNSSRFSVSLAYSFSRSKIKFKDFEIYDIYASRYRDYDNIEFGKVIIESKEEEGVEAQIDILIPKLMDKPSTFKETLKEGGRTLIKFSGTFAEDKAFNISKDTKAQATLNVSYVRSEKEPFEKKKAENKDFVIYAPGAVTWIKGPEAAASFITPDDPIISGFTKNILNFYDSLIVKTQDERNFIKAAIIFDALGKLGIKYHRDDIMPFRDISQTKNVVDNIKYPRQMLQWSGRNGDCDDLTVLLASAFEAANIETAVAMPKGHLFLFFDSGIRPYSADSLLLDSSLYVIKNDKIWIPVEATKLGEPLYEAIKYGKIHTDYKFAAVHDAWFYYEPSYPAKSIDIMPLPTKSEIDELFEKDSNFIAEKGKSTLEGRVDNDPNDMDANFKLFIYYWGKKDYKNAESKMEKLISLDKSNPEFRFLFGLMLNEEKNYIKAFDQANFLMKQFSGDVRGYLLNSIIFFSQSKYEKAKTFYSKAKDLNPDSLLLLKYNIPLRIEEMEEK